MSHIGVVVEDLERAAAEWTEHFGLHVVERETVPEEGVRTVFVSPARTRQEATCIELVEPLDKTDMSNPIAKFLAENGEGLFHAAFLADDPPAAGERLREQGVEAIDLPPAGLADGPRLVVHPKSANGVLVELF